MEVRSSWWGRCCRGSGSSTSRPARSAGWRRWCWPTSAPMSSRSSRRAVTASAPWPRAPLWLRGKRSVTADLRPPTGRPTLHVWCAAPTSSSSAGPPSRAAPLGGRRRRGDRTLRPDLVHCSITGWGPAGPLAEVPGYDAAVAAAQRPDAGVRAPAAPRRPGVRGRAGRQPRRRARRGAGHRRRARSPAAAAAARSVSRPACCRACCRSTSSSCCSSRWPSAAGWKRRTSWPSAATCPRSTTTRCAPRTVAGSSAATCSSTCCMAFLDATDLLGELLADERFIGPPAHVGRRRPSRRRAT